MRKGRLKVGLGAQLAMPIRAKTYFEPDGPGAKGGAGGDLQYAPLGHAVGWTRYGVGYGMEFTSAFHLPTFAIDLGLKWAAIPHEPGNVASLALGADVGGSFIIMSFIVGVSVIGSFHLSEDITLDLATRVGTMTGLWNGPTLTSTVGMSIGRRSTIRFAVGYAMPLAERLAPSTPAIFLGGGWEY